MITLVFNEKYAHIHKTIAINQTIIRGLILYRIHIICSQTSTNATKKHSTKIRDENVQTKSRNLLFQWYVMVNRIISDNTTAIDSIIGRDRCKLNIFKILYMK